MIPLALRSSRFLRFLVVGGLNTLLTYGIFVVLSLVLRAWLAYLAAYGCGIAIAFLANGRWVFAARLTARSVPAYVAMHCGLMGLGAATTAAVQAAFALPGRTAGTCAILAMVPVSFLANRIFFSHLATAAPAAPRTDRQGP